MSVWGDEDEDPKPRWRCPICNKKLLTFRGVCRHMESKHKKPQHQERIAAWTEEHQKWKHLDASRNQHRVSQSQAAVATTPPPQS